MWATRSINELDLLARECLMPQAEQSSGSAGLARAHLSATIRLPTRRDWRKVLLILISSVSFFLVLFDIVPSDTVTTGSKVVQVAPSLMLRPSRSMAVSKAHLTHRINVYQVKNVDGPWLLVANDSDLESGWVRRDEVVSLERGYEYFTNRIKKNPNDLLLFIMRAIICRERRDFDNAMRDVESALRLAPAEGSLYVHRSAIWRARRNYDKAIEDLDRAIQLDPRDPDKYYHRACVWENMGEYDGAISDFTEAIGLNPSDYLAYYSRGLVRYRKKEIDKAVADFTETVRLNPRFAHAYNDRGLCRNDRGEFDRAFSDFNEAIRLKPQFPFAYNNRGNSWLGRGNNDKAISDFSEAIRLDPTYFVAYNNRSSAWYNKGKYAEAIADSTKAIQINLGYASAFLRRGMAHHARKDYRQALENLEHAVKLDERNIRSLSFYAWMLATCPSDEYRDGKRALELSQEACELSGWKDPYMLSTLAASYAEIGEFDLAIIWQTEALKRLMNPKDPDFDYYRSSLNQFKGRKPLRD